MREEKRKRREVREGKKECSQEGRALTIDSIPIFWFFVLHQYFFHLLALMNLIGFYNSTCHIKNKIDCIVIDLLIDF